MEDGNLSSAAGGAMDGRGESPLRAAAARAIAIPGAFVRVDRGAALYISDAPRRAKDTAAQRALQAAGFDVWERDAMLYIVPGAIWVPRICEWAQIAPDEQMKLLLRLKDRPIAAGDFSVWLDAVKAYERREKAGAVLERRIRQNAAIALRDGRCGGALASAWAVVLCMRDNANHPSIEREA